MNWRTNSELDSTSLDTRKRALEQLAMTGDSEALHKALKSQYADVADGAAIFLKDARDPRAVDALSERAKSSQNPELFRCLWNQGDKQGRKLVEVAVYNSNSQVATAAALALVHCQDGDSIELLKSLLYQFSVRQTILNALKRVESKSRRESIVNCLRSALVKHPESHLVDALVILKWTPSNSYEKVLAGLMSNAPNAVAALGPNDIEALLSLLLRGYYAKPIRAALAKMQPQATRALVIMAQQSAAPDDRRCAAIEQLVELKARESCDAISALIKNSSEAVRSAAAHALGKLGDKRAARALVALAHDAAIGKVTSDAYQLARSTNEALLKLLRQSSADLEPDQLKSIAELKSVVLVYSSDSKCNLKPDREDFSQLRQLARQELLRRGFEA